MESYQGTTEKKHIDLKQTVREYHRVVAHLATQELPSNGTVADFGAGTGNTLRLIKDSRPDARVVAYDIDSDCLKAVKLSVPSAEVKKLDPTGGVSGDDNTYDIVILSHVLEHLPNAVEALRSLEKHVAKGGKMIIAVPNAHNIRFITRALRRKHSVNEGHVCIWDRPHWVNLLEGIMGYTNVQHYNDIVVVPLLHRFKLGQSIERRIARLIPWFSVSHISVITPEPK